MKGLLKKGQYFIFEHKGPELIHSDNKLLKNICINLVSNAIKFSDEGQPIEIKSEVVDGIMRMSVADKGIGISKEDQEHLYSSFYRGKNATNIQGTGLGLHIVKRYLELLGGEIDLESKIEEGTRFTITVPINAN
jgi:signal transduction histidine kinase